MNLCLLYPSSIVHKCNNIPQLRYQLPCCCNWLSTFGIIHALVTRIQHYGRCLFVFYTRPNKFKIIEAVQIKPLPNMKAAAEAATAGIRLLAECALLTGVGDGVTGQHVSE